MNQYIHHVPGRIRVKSPLIKRSDTRAQAVFELLRALDGVIAVEVSTLTGSVVVNYDRDRLDAQRILETLQAYGHLEVPTTGAMIAAAGDAAAAERAATIGQSFGKAIFGVLVEKALERSAVALIGAII
jgi:copper chaperone CopZ